MKQILTKLDNLPFEFESDKKCIGSFITSLDEILTDDKHRDELEAILTEKGKELTGFDSGIFLDPRRLLIAIARSDILGQLINHEEFHELYETLENYILYHEGVLEDMKWIEDTYNIEIKKIDEPTERNHIVATPLSEVAYIAAIPVLKELIAKYPPVFIDTIRLDGIVLASSFTKKHAGGACVYLGGFETNADNFVYLSSNTLHKSFDHEVYHQAMQNYHDASEWGNLRTNNDVFYQVQHSSKPTQGFAVNYGRENISEDQATMAEYMLRNYAHMKKRSEHDSILKKKMILVHEAYKYLSEGFMDEKWFENLKS